MILKQPTVVGSQIQKLVAGNGESRLLPVVQMLLIAVV